MTSSSTFVIPSSSSSFWQSSATTGPPHNSSPDQNQHCDIGPGYAGDLANSYNAIWEHHHHHHHHHHSNNGNSPVAVPPYRTEFFPGFACSTELWHSPAHTPPARPLNNGMQINRDTYRSTGATSQQRPSGNKHSSSSSSSQKKTRRRVATFAQRRAANIRERRRMFNLNEAFDKLRRKVPTFAYEKRLSRIETLRLAITYISFMDEILNGNPVNSDGVPASSLYQMQNQREYVPYVIL